MPRPLSAIANFVACGFGSGYFAKAPGTFATFLTMVGYLIADHFFLLHQLPLHTKLAVLSVATLIGIWLCQHAATSFQRKDPPQVVWDEIVGYMIAVIFAPPTVAWAGFAFLMFRVLDITKPFPIKQLERLPHNGSAIMLDDVMAGAVTALTIQIIVTLSTL